MSASTLPIEGSFFFTDVDPEVALKDSRDLGALQMPYEA
jgi:hypothetical protein